MTLNVYTVLTVISLFLTLFISLFFLFNRKGKPTANKLLSIFLFIFFVQIANSFAISNWTFMYFINYHKIIMILRQTGLLTGPLLMLYIVVSIKRNKPFFRYIDFLHFIPFFVSTVLIYIIIREESNFILWKSPVNSVMMKMIIIHNFIYMVVTVLFVKMNNISFRTFFKLLSESSYIAWFQFFIIGCIMLWIVNVYALALVIRKTEWCPFTNSIYAISVFIFITSGLLILMEKPGIYIMITRYKGYQIQEETGNYYKDLLITHMKNNKPYLDPEISLAKLSKDLSVKERLLSQIINNIFKMNFKSFINHFRLQESMIKLSDPENKNKTILEILYDTGFNSKSVFNARFKKYTGLTPQEFKQLSQKENQYIVNEKMVLKHVTGR